MCSRKFNGCEEFPACASQGLSAAKPFFCRALSDTPYKLRQLLAHQPPATAFADKEAGGAASCAGYGLDLLLF
jgi:hypothetical protein